MLNKPSKHDEPEYWLNRSFFLPTISPVKRFADKVLRSVYSNLIYLNLLLSCIPAHTHTHTHSHSYRSGRVLANGPGDWGSIPGRVIPKTGKTVLIASLLNTQHYKIRIKGKWGGPGKVVTHSLTPRCGSFWKGSLQFTLDKGLPT